MSSNSTWIDFYNNLTASSRNAAQFGQATRTLPSAVNLTYPTKPSAGGSARPGKKKNDGFFGKEGYKFSGAYGLGLVPGLIADTMKDTEGTVGGRVIDVLSRGLYAASNAQLEQQRQARSNHDESMRAQFGDKYNPQDGLERSTGNFLDVLKAAGRGLTGEDKTTTREVLEDQDRSTRGVTGFAKMFAGDVVSDPLTYMGVGAISKAAGAAKAIGGLRGVKATGRTAKEIADAEKAIEGVVVNDKTATDLIQQVKAKREPDDNIFENIFSKPSNAAPHPTRGLMPEDSRVFNVDSAGMARETLQLPGPSPDVLAARATLKQTDEMAKGVPQFQYGSWIDEAPETGFFKETTRKVPLEDATPPNTVTEGKRALQEKYANLDDSDMPENPAARIIMSQVDEPVFPRYEAYEATHTLDSGKTITWKAWRPNPEDIQDGLGMPMGEIRARLRDPKISPTAKQNYKKMLVNHIRAVESYARSNPAGFKGKAGYEAFYKEMYGTSPSKLAKNRTEISPLPPSPFDNAPKFREITEYNKMDAIDKSIFLHHMKQQGLSEAHITYLSQASNMKSYSTRLKNLQNMLREGGTKDALDLAEAIEQGRIQSLEEPGIKELLDFHNAKSLPGLAKKIRTAQRKRDAAEHKMFNKGNKGDLTAATKVEVKAAGATAELGPTGKKYKPYATNIGKMVDQAKQKAQTNTPAQTIIERAMAGDKSDLAKPAVEFSQSQKSIFEDGLRWAVNENIIQPKDAAVWKYVTRTGVKRTAKTRNKGRGRVQDAWNAYSQYDFLKGMLTNVRKMDTDFRTWATATGVDSKDYRYARAKFMYNMAMKPMEAMDDLLKQGGIFPVAGTRASDVPFSLHDAFASFNPAFIQRHFFSLNPKTHETIIAPTQFLEALSIGVTAIRQGDDVMDIGELMLMALREQKTTRGGKPIPNGLNAYLGDDANRIEEFMQEIADGMPELVQRVEKNEAARKLWHENQRATATQDAFDEIARRVESPDINLANILELSNKVDSEILPKIQRFRGVDQEDMFYTKANVTGGLNELGMPAEVRATAKRAERRAKAKPADVHEIDLDAVRESNEMAMRSMEEEGISLADAATRFDRTFLHRMITEIFPHFGNERLRNSFLERKSAMQSVSRMYQSQISTIAEKHSHDTYMAAWRELQIGTWSKDPDILAAQKDLNKAIGVIFSDTPEYSLFARNGLDNKQLKNYFEQYKIPTKFQPGPKQALHDVWKNWDSDDPLQLLSQYFAAASRASAKKMLGDHLTVEFGSKTKKAGYVKLKRGNSPLLADIDVDNYYFPQDIAREMNVLDRFLREEAVPSYSDTTGGKLLRMYDNILHRYKSGLTIYRPGHHVRNMVGDEWLTYMAGDLTPSSHTKALKVMTTMRGRFDDFDAIKALATGDEIAPTVKGDTVISKVKVKGKEVPLTAHEIYRRAFDSGILPDYRTLEDIQIGAESETLFKKGPFGGRVHNVAASVSQGRDHYVRLAHLIAHMEKGNFNSLEHAFEAGTRQVRKWHPDGSDLSHLEQRFGRRTILFYSWLRKAVPLIIEGMALNPGRAMVYPKAMYDMAVAQGLDPDSLSNPFPEDQLFPDWITEGLQGPVYQDDQDRYWGINPGVPMMDVLGDYAGESAGSSMLGSITPLAKIPFELNNKPEGAVAQDTRTGIPYFDKSDYIDKQIPNANLFVGSTGRSLTQPWQSKGGEGKDVEPDAERSIFNFLAGMGAMNMSKESYIRQAKRENTRDSREAEAERVARIMKQVYGG